ncbi:replication initiator protein A [Enterococcus faecalis]|uniref:replication initiator protein A n=1 Tax=Bacilli TaxID=91061 RepID=UPI000CF0F9F2|nr:MULTISPECIES: replication initiator protein A [Bacilli]EGO2646231.1 replication protein RepA [Enterococcus faecalis]EGO2801425.1 replication protein RepA [Enterococcus faecalis]EGO5857427.1 replication protein RepA [Enterococcus faecalis]EGO6585936.1 replication protein RepA [Enterococcus faecalis]EGO8256038.1 replication protein RepA [Enterococcus faecalis]
MTNIKERGYSYQNSYSELFWKFPQFLLKNEKYKSMKDSSKIAYMLFKDKISLALTNNWIDEDGMIYLIFQQKDIMEMLNCYQGKVKSTLDELEKYGLLEVVRGGFDAKAGKNIANKYYLLQPELKKEDLYLSANTNSKTLDSSGYAEIARREKNSETLDSSGYAEIARREKNVEPLDNSGYAEIAQVKDNIYINNSLDTIDTIDTKKERLQQQLLLEQFAEVQENTFLSKDSLKFIAAFSDTIQEAHEMVGTIIRAKTKVEKEYNIVLIGEDYQEEIDKCLRRVMHKIKTDSTVKSPKGLFYKSFYNLFVECTIEKKSHLNKNSTDNSPEITTHNWIEYQ